MSAPVQNCFGLRCLTEHEMHKMNIRVDVSRLTRLCI